MLTCTTCGDKGDCNGTIPKCANCWEVEKRLAYYLKSEAGKTFVNNAYKAANSILRWNTVIPLDEDRLKSVLANKAKTVASHCAELDVKELFAKYRSLYPCITIQEFARSIGRDAGWVAFQLRTEVRPDHVVETRNA